MNLHTGQWSFEQAVKYFMDAGGLDREAAEGEAAGAASRPSQKISYITGKWQIMRLLGRYRDSQGENFRLGAFHDQLIRSKAERRRVSALGRAALTKLAIERAEAYRLHIEWALRQPGMYGRPISRRAAANKLNERNTESTMGGRWSGAGLREP